MTLPIDTARMLSNELVTIGAPVVSVVLHGSAVLGGWTPGRSDLDLLVIVDDAIEPGRLRDVVGLLVAVDPVASGMHLEASVVTCHAAATIRDRWPYLAHVNSAGRPTIDDAIAAPDADDPDLLMHYAVARHAGVAVAGSPAPDVIGSVARTLILAYLADEMRWGLEHGSAAYALLNACRARVLLDTGTIVSKIQGGQRALAEPDGPHVAIEAALAWQRGTAEMPVLDRTARAYIERTARALAAAGDTDAAR